MSQITCQEAETLLSAYGWLFMMGPGLLTICTVILLLLALFFLAKIPKLGKDFKELTMNLSLTAMRNGIGNLAKTALLAEIPSNPELAKVFKGAKEANNQASI